MRFVFKCLGLALRIAIIAFLWWIAIERPPRGTYFPVRNSVFERPTPPADRP